MQKGKGKDAALGPMFEATWREQTFEVYYGELDASVSTRSSNWELHWISREPTAWKELKEPESLERVPSRRGMAA